MKELNNTGVFSIGSEYKGLWKIKSFIKGGMSTIYFCDPTKKNSTKNVIKTIEPEEYLDQDSYELFNRECLILSTISKHPHIVETLMVDRVGISPVVVLEYLKGGNLRNLIKNQSLTIKNILTISFQICATLKFLLENIGLLHRDLKPENILIKSLDHIKIADFGLSFTNKDFILNRITKNTLEDDTAYNIKLDRVAGTLGYIAPEILLDSNAYSVESDIYSFGIVMYELVTKIHPFTFENISELVSAYSNYYIKEPIQLVKIPTEFNNLIMRCLNKNPKQRYNNYNDIISTIKSISEKENINTSNYNIYTLEELEKDYSDNDFSKIGYSLGKLRKFNESFNYYKKAYDLNPTSAINNNNLGVAYLRLGKYNDAIKFYEIAANLEPNQSYIQATLAEGYLAIKDTEAAITAYRKAVSLSPNDISLIRRLAITLHKANYKTEYDELIKRVIEILNTERYKMYRESWDNEAIMFGEEGLHDTALLIQKEAKKLHSKSYQFWYNFAITNIRLYDLDFALNCLNKSIQLNPDFISGRIIRGILNFLIIKLDLAIKDWSISLQINPNHQKCAIIGKFLSLILIGEGIPPEILDIYIKNIFPSLIHYEM